MTTRAAPPGVDRPRRARSPRRAPRPRGLALLALAAAGLAAAAVLGAGFPGRAAAPAAPLRQPPEEAARAAGGIHDLDRDADRIRRLLKEAGWVSPGARGRVLWMVSFRSCPDCVRFETEAFPALRRAGVDTRVIMVARRAKSTAPERASVAELWARRRWSLYERWTSTPVDAWDAAELPDADADPARAALVEKGRAFVDALTPLLAENGVELRYPTLIWSEGRRLRGCACEDRSTYRYILSALGVPAGDLPA